MWWIACMYMAHDVCIWHMIHGVSWMMYIWYMIYDSWNMIYDIYNMYIHQFSLLLQTWKLNRCISEGLALTYFNRNHHNAHIAHESHIDQTMHLGQLVHLPPRQPEGCLQGSDVTIRDPWYCFYSRKKQIAQSKSLNAVDTKRNRYWQAKLMQVKGQGCETKLQSPFTCCLQALPIVSDLHWVPDSQVQESPKKAALVSNGWWRIKYNLLLFALLFAPWTLPTWSCLASQSAVSHPSNQTNRNLNDWSDTSLLQERPIRVTSSRETHRCANPLFWPPDHKSQFCWSHNVWSSG